MKIITRPIRAILAVIVLSVALLAGATSALSVGGLFNFDLEIILNNDGSGIMKIIFTVDDALYESEEGEYVSEVFTELVEEVSDLDGFTLITGSEYESAEMHILEKKFSFKDILVFSNEDFQISFGPDGDTMVFAVNLLLPDEDEELFAEDESATDEIQDIVALLASHHFRFRVTVPEVVVEAPEARVTGKTAVWTIPMDRIFLSHERAIQMRVVY